MVSTRMSRVLALAVDGASPSLLRINYFLFSHPSYILWLYYTTDGETVALIVVGLRVQARRVEV